MTSPPQLQFRLAGSADADAVFELSRRTVIDTFAHLNDPKNFASFLDEHYRVDLVQADLIDPTTRILIAEVNAVPAAYARICTDDVPGCIGDDGAIQIERFYVDKPFIGKGIAAEMMAHCLSIAREGGHRTIFLGVWEHNARAIRFYEKWGFKCCGEHDFMVGDDRQIDLWMLRPVNQ